MKEKMLLNKIIYMGAITVTLLFPLSSFAFLPVIDVTAIANMARELSQLKHQYDLLNQTYQSSQNTLYQAKTISSEGQGHYGFGNLFNGPQYTAHREWSPDNWQEVLQGLSGGNPQRYQQLVSQYQSDNPTLSVSNFDMGSSASNGQIYQAQIQNNQAASVTASYAFNNIKDHIEHIQQISNQIESAPNQKAATDLNTRMDTEIAYTQIEVLKQLALMNEQTAHHNEDQIKYETEASKFNRLPDE